MSVDEKLVELGIVLTEGTKPVANYVSARRLGNVLYVSGHICKRDGVLITGKLGAEVDVCDDLPPGAGPFRTRQSFGGWI